jgi:hypothetical protein
MGCGPTTVRHSQRDRSSRWPAIDDSSLSHATAPPVQVALEHTAQEKSRSPDQQDFATSDALHRNAVLGGDGGESNSVLLVDQCRRVLADAEYFRILPKRLSAGVGFCRRPFGYGFGYAAVAASRLAHLWQAPDGGRERLPECHAGSFVVHLERTYAAFVQLACALLCFQQYTRVKTRLVSE